VFSFVVKGGNIYKPPKPKRLIGGRNHEAIISLEIYKGRTRKNRLSIRDKESS